MELLERKLKEYANNNDYIFSFMDGKMIGINLKIMLKYIKTSLGKNLKNYGILFTILGFLSAISISLTIILSVIINIALEEKTIINNAVIQPVPNISDMGAEVVVYDGRENQTSISRNTIRNFITVKKKVWIKILKKDINFKLKDVVFFLIF